VDGKIDEEKNGRKISDEKVKVPLTRPKAQRGKGVEL
jgi:hypothetical protein